MATAIIQKPHYFMAFLVAQNKKTITQPCFLNVCNFVYQQDIKASVTPKKLASNVQDSSDESDGGGKPKAVTHPKQKQNTHEYGGLLGKNIGEVSAIANTTQQLLFTSQGPNAIERSQFEAQAADHLVYMRKSLSSEYCELLLGAPKRITGMMSVPVIAKATAIPAPVAPNLTAQVTETAKRTPSPQGLGIPTICKEVIVCQPKLRESLPAADVPATTFENNSNSE